MTEAPKLKPCPFCGGEAYLEPQVPCYSGAWVECLACECRVGPLADDSNDVADMRAVVAWNRRDDAEVQRLVAEARAEAFEEAAEICDEERYNLSALTSMPPQSASVVAARNRILALSDAPPRQWIANCCVCQRIVDTREEADGGDPHGCELQNGRWVCSGDCWDTAVGDAPRQVTPQEAAKVLLEALEDEKTWPLAVNAATPILRADVADSCWNTTSEIKDALSAALRALANGGEG